ncbi:hypothetical protein Ppa06_07810 [Planomonospora parontospora subsp. parontospora]|uniref:Uncharacterized protein n=2 Tax=Planomonospora parontospora TaxID=58119 RepID=A0AA37BCQ1_9ACTN|nr:hypothetical protein [Planomonospora parontospora]GGK51559.1 hypothetical protein GCM10010126_08800 [Planomonospora parontospora]GII06983.1 hypothetical protein Ppa06_07810 [Planomonospora parontospora subsp. parontospora]
MVAALLVPSMWPQGAGPLGLVASVRPAAPAPGVSWIEPLLIACAIVPALFFALVKGETGGRSRAGCLGWPLKALALWAGANVMAYPAGVLMYLGTAELDRHPEVWLVTAASPFAALAVAWWFRPVLPPLRRPYLVLRAVLLLAACVTAVLAAERSGLPVTSVSGTWAGASLAAALACVAAWRMADGLAPLPQLAWAAAVLGACVAVGVTTGVDGLAVLTGEQAGSGAALWAAFLLAVLQAAAVLLLGSAVWRLVRQLRTGTLSRAADRSGGLWPPRPGEVWYANVPFREDGNESKDRPVLVLRASAGHADVLKITSQDKTGMPSHLHLPLARWHRVLNKESWLELRVTPLAYANFHDVQGLCRPDVWRELGRRGLRSGGRTDARPARPGSRRKTPGRR